jgi:hypothetical protein
VSDMRHELRRHFLCSRHNGSLLNSGADRMQRSDAEREIIREWEALHESQRQTERHVGMFAMAIKDKYPFKYNGDRYQAIKAIIARHQRARQATK